MDLSLYPIDTLKTRLQSAKGFAKSGGFRGVYAGVGSALVGSAPGAALFFITYEWTKARLHARETAQVNSGDTINDPPGYNSNLRTVTEHMIAASVGEIAACAVRVPTEVVKQRAQASTSSTSSLSELKYIIAQGYAKGGFHVFKGLYRGWSITVLREVPFTIIQFPLWEALKKQHQQRNGTRETTAVASAAFGCISGAVAAAMTTPLDVLKTRIMLAREKTSMIEQVRFLLQGAGPSAFFAGIVPRVSWISAGGAIFLGTYQLAMNALYTP